ncbi:MAG: hypothetical protein ACWA5Q_02525 [bacterium]
MKLQILGLMGLLLLSFDTIASLGQFDLSIRGAGMEITRQLQLRDYREGESAIEFPFNDKSGNAFWFELRYQSLPVNRSYPANLDVTIKDKDKNKLAYLFWANNGLKGLHKIGIFGLVFDLHGQPVDVQFKFAKPGKGSLDIDQLDSERFVQDTLVPKLGFQMIRPVIIPKVADDTRSVTYSLDSHPYNVNYTLKQIGSGQVEFQFNLNSKVGEQQHLLSRVYYHASSLEALREGMFAGKYFDEHAGTFKLVYYPAMGQISPQ